MTSRGSLAVAAAVCTAAALLSGCGSNSSEASAATTPRTGGDPSTAARGSSNGGPSKAVLDAYVANARRAMKAMYGNSFTKLYSSMRIEPKYPNGIRYVYVFKQPVDPAQGAPLFEKQTPVLKATYRTQVAPEMRKLGFAQPSVTWTYVNPDGSLVWTHTVP